MSRRGHRLWLACCEGSRLQQEAEQARIAVLPYSVSGYFHPTIVLRLRKFISDHKVEIIHCQVSKDLATVVPAMRLSGLHVPVLLSKRIGSYVNKKDILHRFTYAHVSKVLAISTVIHKNVLDTTPMTSDRVLTLHDAVDTEKFSPERVDRRAVRAAFGLGDNIVAIGFVGRFSPGKGHEELLNAAAALRTRYPSARYLVVGEASYGEETYERKMKDLCHDLGLDTVVTFAGFRKDIAEVMSAFDIFAFPSHAESFGVVLIEAMAMELPVVSTNCDGVLDIMVDGETGIFVNPRSSQELANALSRLIRDPTLRTQMGKAGRTRVKFLFDQKAHSEKLEKIYYSLVKARQEQKIIT